MIRRSVETVATSNADDAAYLALEDVARITEDLDEVRVVGGHMTSLLLTAFPVSGAVIRRTADADAAISTSIAVSGRIHRALTNAGYVDTSGNHYAKGRLEVDLLVPSGTDEFVRVEHGGRGFDAAPGLMRVFAVEPIVLDVGVMLTNGSRHGFAVRVPPVELAVTLKAYAATSRAAPRPCRPLQPSQRRKRIRRERDGCVDSERQPSRRPTRRRAHPPRHCGQGADKWSGPRCRGPAGPIRRVDPQARYRSSIVCLAASWVQVRPPACGKAW